MSEYPMVRRTRLPNSREVFAVIGDVARDPTLQVVGAVGGENFTCGEIVCEMCHSMYLPFFCDIIIPYFCGLVNPFDELFTIYSQLRPGTRS